MSEVYRARDATLGRIVANKLLAKAGMTDQEEQARFLAEARLTGSLQAYGILSR